jgi:hypothetical protein
MAEALCFLTIAEAARRLRGGDLSPIALTEAFLERIDAKNSKIDAYILVAGDQALDAARLAEQVRSTVFRLHSKIILRRRAFVLRRTRGSFSTMCRKRMPPWWKD